MDQDQGSRAFAARLFERAGFAIDEAASGEEAMASAREVRPSLVLLDVVLPDLSGFEIARELRDEFGDDLPIIFISGDRTEPLDRAAGLLVGGDDYVVKPADPDELLARARRLISRSRRGRVASSWTPVRSLPSSPAANGKFLSCWQGECARNRSRGNS